MKFEEMNEYTILALAEKATFKFDDKPLLFFLMQKQKAGNLSMLV